MTGAPVPLAERVAAVLAGRSTAAAWTAAALARIAELDGAAGLNAFLASDAAAASAAARALDERVRAAPDIASPVAGAALPLAGAPVALKDNICTLDLPTTCASRMLDGYISPYEATVVRRLRAAGAVIIGKTNLDEFAMGSSTERSAYGPTRHAQDRTRVPGGSSGGSAVAVAAGMAAAALGSDTGGSVRQPAAFCGIVGIKPSWGRVSRYGLVAYASSLDQVGVLGSNVADAARVLHVIAGHDPRDATSAPRPVPDLTVAARPPAGAVAGLVVGVPDEYFGADVDPRVAACCRAALERMRAAGATIRGVSLPHTRYALPAYYVIATAEASSNLARFDGVRYGGRPAAGAVYDAARARFGAEVKRRIVLGTFVLSAGHHAEYYDRAQRARRMIAADFTRVFDDGVDVLFTPTAPTPAFRLGEKTDDPYAMYQADIFTVAANLAALPALSLPIGAADGLPVGGQLVAARWHEAGLVAAAAVFERELAP